MIIISCLMLAASAAGGQETAGSVAGLTFLGQEGHAIPGVTVCVKGIETCVLSDANGHFEIHDVPGGRVSLTAQLREWAARAETVALVSPGKTCEAVLILTDVSTIIDCEANLGEGPTIYGVRGKVVDSALHPVGHAALEVRQRDGKVIWRGRSDRRGDFRRTGFPFGTYVLEVNKRGYATQMMLFRAEYCDSQPELTIPLAKACDQRDQRRGYG
jgi:Carboxypeptidase regulatory-like domain